MESGAGATTKVKQSGVDTKLTLNRRRAPGKNLGGRRARGRQAGKERWPSGGPKGLFAMDEAGETTPFAPANKKGRRRLFAMNEPGKGRALCPVSKKRRPSRGRRRLFAVNEAGKSHAFCPASKKAPQATFCSEIRGEACISRSGPAAWRHSVWTASSSGSSKKASWAESPKPSIPRRVDG